MTRNDGRKNNQIRPVEFVLDYVDYPEGSVLISIGNTRVLCNVSIEDQVPAWMEKSDLQAAGLQLSTLFYRGQLQSG